jgi:ABC-type multidrug transport system fused ATPase/permease subunit
MGVDSQAISGCSSGRPNWVNEGERVACADRQGTGLVGVVSGLAKSLMLLSGPVALVGFVLGKEKISAFASIAFEKLSEATAHVVGTVASNFTSFSLGVLGASALNVIDGYRGYRASSKSLAEVNEKLKTFAEGSAEHQAFSKLKQLHQSKRTRSLLQGFIGMAAATVGGLALAGVLTNPYALLAVGAVAGAAFFGAQLNKWVNNQKVRRVENGMAALDDVQRGDSACTVVAKASNEAEGPQG